MERKNIKEAIEFAVTSFLPAAFLFVVAILLIISKGNFGVFREISWSLLCLELIILTSGFSLMLIFLMEKGIELKRSRGVLAGIVSIILLGVASIFFQGAGRLTIAGFSLIVGIISALTMLPFNKRPLL